MTTYCKNCEQLIKIQIFMGGDWCSDDCRKALVEGAKGGSGTLLVKKRINNYDHSHSED